MKTKHIIGALAALAALAAADSVRLRAKLRAHEAEAAKLLVLVEETQQRVDAAHAETNRALDGLERSVKELEGSVSVWEARKRAMQATIELAQVELEGERAKVRALANRLGLDPETFTAIPAKKVY